MIAVEHYLGQFFKGWNAMSLFLKGFYERHNCGSIWQSGCPKIALLLRLMMLFKCLFLLK